MLLFFQKRSFLRSGNLRARFWLGTCAHARAPVCRAGPAGLQKIHTSLIYLFNYFYNNLKICIIFEFLLKFQGFLCPKQAVFYKICSVQGFLRMKRCLLFLFTSSQPYIFAFLIKMPVFGHKFVYLLILNQIYQWSSLTCKESGLMITQRT